MRAADMNAPLRVFICTRDDRLLPVEPSGFGWASETLLDGMEVQCVAADGPRVLIGTRDRGVLLSTDAGESWETIVLPEPHVYSVAISAADGALYAGTE